MNDTKVVVTGIGLATSLGDEREASWIGLRAGRSGLSPYHLEGGPGAYPSFACTFRRTGQARSTALLLKTSVEALEDARMLGSGPPIDRDRVGTVVTMSKGNLDSMARVHSAAHRVPRAELLMPHPWWCSWPNYTAVLLALNLDYRGPCLSPIAACASGVIAALRGVDLIRQGLCDIVLVGAGDCSLSPLVLGAFARMRALARVGSDPARAVRPWDRARSGFLVGEGAAILILERDDHARARGVLPYAELAGGAFGSDAYHITDLNPDPSGLAHWIGRALEDAHASPSDIDHINVHGTATRQNDPLECRAIRRAFGSHADSISCSANKPQIGHLLGAAGAAELAITCLAIRDGFVPPTLNLDDPDPACDLDGTPHVGKHREIRAALKLSIGFGGHLAAAVLRRYDGPRREPVTP